MSLTDEQRAEQVKALTRELHYYETYDQPERAAQVRQELDRLGAEAAPPQKRAAKRAKSKAEKRTEL